MSPRPDLPRHPSRRTILELLIGGALGRGYANPVTYRTSAGRQFVVIATGAGEEAEVVAFSLPE